MFDLEGKQQQSLGQIIWSAIRSLFLIIGLTLVVSVVLSATSILMRQIDYIFNNAYHLDQPQEREFTEEEYAAMGRVLATIGNYSMIPNSNNRYNINLCFNDIRGDMDFLQKQGVFNYIMDEFGNMPKIDKFGQMITVGRSRKIWFSMVVQSFVQLTNVYGKEIADIVIGNCGVKMFIGSNDTETCKMFSEMCGNMTVKTTSTSSSLGSKAGDISVSTNTQVRPLIYPSELQRLNNQESTGNSIIVSFNSFPLRTKYTPSYKCPFYKFGPMDLTEIRSNMFKADEVYYDLAKRNEKILGSDDLIA